MRRSMKPTTLLWYIFVGKMKEDERQDKIITTVWGVGYKIEK